MSYTITNNIMYVRDDTGELVPVSMIASGADKTIQAIKDTAAAAESQIEAKTDEQVARIPEVTTLAKDVSALKDEKLDKTPSTWPEWTAEQQAQARENIAAAGVARVESVETALGGKLDNMPGTWPVWTADEQAKARERMSVENGSDFELLVDAVLEEEANTFLVQFPKPVRECIYHIWFYNNNNSNVVAQTKCLDSGTDKYYLLKYTSGIATGRGYVLNGYFRYNGPISSRSIIGYASDASVPSWTTDISGNGNIAYMAYPTDMILKKVDGLSFSLADTNHVLNVGATIKVWGR